MLRKATKADIDAIDAIYELVHDDEESGRVEIGWARGTYPVRAVAERAVAAGTMWALDRGGRLVAAGIINQEQVPEYANASWTEDVPDDAVMVLHTLVVDPRCGRSGIGREFVGEYERIAREAGCTWCRIDTNERNARARAMYAKLGYREASVVPCVFNGIEGVRLVCLEKRCG